MTTQEAEPFLIIAADPPEGGTVATLSPSGEPVHAGVPVPHPLHITRHGNHVYAASGDGDGAVAALQLDAEGALHETGTAPSGGATPCHLAVDPQGRYLLAANYDGGTVAVRALDDHGHLGRTTDIAELPPPQHPVDHDRQDRAHPHQVVFDPAGRYLLVSDLGADRIWAFQLDPATGRLHQANVSALPPGCGPRNLAFQPGDATGAWIACELDSTILRCDYDPETAALTLRGTTPASQEHQTRNYPGAITASAAHHSVYIANRGSNTIATVSGGTVTETPCGGEWPMDLIPAGPTLLAANRDTGNIAIFKLDLQTGIPAQHTSDLAVTRPTSILLATRRI